MESDSGTVEAVAATIVSSVEVASTDLTVASVTTVVVVAVDAAFVVTGAVDVVFVVVVGDGNDAVGSRAAIAKENEPATM